MKAPKPSGKIIKKDSPEARHRDIYHNLLKISWYKLFIIYILFFLVINIVFASLYLLVPGSITTTPHHFQNAFFFSVQTFSTVGYGTISPLNLYGNMIVVIEIMTGVLSMALTTGIFFAKFSRPSAKILYSKNLLLTRFDGEDVLMFRIANARSNQIISANVEVHTIFNSITKEGHKIVRFSSLKLKKNYSPIFALSWSIFHPIDSSSPFFGKSYEEILALRYEFAVVVHGNDGTFSQTVYDTHRYKGEDILKNHYFVDILSTAENGARIIDFKNFHNTISHD